MKKRKKKTLLRRLNGLKKVENILKRMSSRIKKPRNHPWKKLSNVYKTVKNKLKRGRKYKIGGRTKKRRKKRRKKKAIRK